MTLLTRVSPFLATIRPGATRWGGAAFRVRDAGRRCAGWWSGEKLLVQRGSAAMMLRTAFRRGMASRRATRLTTLVVLACCLMGSSSWSAALAQESPAAAEKLFRLGEYQQVIEMADKAIAARQLDERWYLLKIRAEMATGRYAEAMKSYEAGGGRYDQSIALRLLAYDVYRMNDMPAEAEG